MGIISKNELKAGDHIFTWRTGYIYAHHGIYIGEDIVIHFTPQGGSETKTRSFFRKIITSSTQNGHKDPCVKCGDQSNPSSSSTSSSKSCVVSSCLDCFLAGGNLYLYDYDVSLDEFLSRPRGGTCTTVSSHPPQYAVYRSKYLLEHNGFGEYNLFKNNCEDFAVYCKTSLVVRNRSVTGGSGQIHSVVEFMLILFSVCGFGAGARVRSRISGIVRLLTNIGTRKDVVQMSVKSLVDQMNVS